MLCGLYFMASLLCYNKYLKPTIIYFCSLLFDVKYVKFTTIHNFIRTIQFSNEIFKKKKNIELLRFTKQRKKKNWNKVKVEETPITSERELFTMRRSMPPCDGTGTTQHKFEKATREMIKKTKIHSTKITTSRHKTCVCVACD